MLRVARAAGQVRGRLRDGAHGFELLGFLMLHGQHRSSGGHSHVNICARGTSCAHALVLNMGLCRDALQVDDDMETRYLRAQKSRLDFSLIVPNKGDGHP